MRWQWIDRIESFEPWRAARALKALSFEECALARIVGRQCDFPESLVLASCLELVRLLVAVSSGFTRSCTLAAVDRFAFERVGGPGGVLQLSAEVRARDEHALSAGCRVSCAGRSVGEGMLEVSLHPMADFADPELVAAMWRERGGGT